ncbi:hypothetical protein BGC_24070 [Burkholderia sp. 3C]
MRAESDQFARARIVLRMRVGAVDKRRVAARAAERVERRPDFEWNAAFGQCQRDARMVDQVDVRIGVERLGGAFGRVAFGPAAGAQPAVAVAGGAAVREADRMQHRRLRPPRQQVLAGEAAVERVRAVAYQPAVQVGRDRAGHAQLGEIGFVGNRRERAGVEIERGGHRAGSMGRSGGEGSYLYPGVN